MLSKECTRGKEKIAHISATWIERKLEIDEDKQEIWISHARKCI
jgi:hypothetical protein